MKQITNRQRFNWLLDILIKLQKASTLIVRQLKEKDNQIIERFNQLKLVESARSAAFADFDNFKSDEFNSISLQIRTLDERLIELFEQRKQLIAQIDNVSLLINSIISLFANHQEDIQRITRLEPADNNETPSSVNQSGIIPNTKWRRKYTRIDYVLCTMYQRGSKPSSLDDIESLLIAESNLNLVESRLLQLAWKV